MIDSSYQPFKYVQTAPDVERWYIYIYVCCKFERTQEAATLTKVKLQITNLPIGVWIIQWDKSMETISLKDWHQGGKCGTIHSMHTYVYVRIQIFIYRLGFGAGVKILVMILIIQLDLVVWKRSGIPFEVYYAT